MRSGRKSEMIQKKKERQSKQDTEGHLNERSKNIMTAKETIRNTGLGKKEK